MTEQIVVVGVVLLIIVLGVLARRREGSPAVRRTADRERALATPVAPDALAEIRQHLAANRKINAVKRAREATHLGLADAVALVEAIEAGHEPPAFPTSAAPSTSTTPTSTASSPAAGTGEVRPDLADRARKLRREGREIEAIRTVCDETGMGLLEAQKFVRSLD